MTVKAIERPDQVLISAARELAIMATFNRDVDLVADMRWRWRVIGQVLDSFEKENPRSDSAAPDK
jgi:hypothetical protein